jgi:hypothetical protein
MQVQMVSVSAYPEACPCIFPRATTIEAGQQLAWCLTPASTIWLNRLRSRVSLDQKRSGRTDLTYRADCDLVMAARARHLEGHIVWGVALDL